MTMDEPTVTLRLRDALDWLMVSDPTQLTSEQDDRVRATIDDAARAAGFDGWVVAYHEMTDV